MWITVKNLQKIVHVFESSLFKCFFNLNKNFYNIITGKCFIKNCKCVIITKSGFEIQKNPEEKSRFKLYLKEILLQSRLSNFTAITFQIAPESEIRNFIPCWVFCFYKKLFDPPGIARADLFFQSNRKYSIYRFILKFNKDYIKMNLLNGFPLP